MISWSKKRQLSILTILLIIFLLGAGTLYYFFLSRPPTCFDGRKNGDEQGIDCGGLCARVCESSAQEPLMRWDPRMFRISSSTYAVIAYFENPNVSFRSRRVGYRFEVRGERGILTTKEGEYDIPPNILFVVYDTVEIKSGAEPKSVRFEWTEPIVWERTTPPVTLDIRGIQLKEGNQPRVDAVVLNESLESVRAAEFVAIVTDGAKNAVGTSRTVVRDIPSRSRRDIVFTWNAPFITTTSVCAVPLDVALIIDRSGSMDDAGGEPPEPLTSVKNAAQSFVRAVSSSDRVGILSFANTVSEPVDLPLTFDKALTERAIDMIAIATSSVQNTNIAEGLSRGRALLLEEGRQDARKIAILLTDGIPTLPERQNDLLYPETLAREEALKLRQDSISLFTIGLGPQVKSSFLAGIASSTSEYFYAPSTADLEKIYLSIAKSLCVSSPVSVQIIPRILE